MKWIKGDDFIPEDVIQDFTIWVDGALEGNSMASRVSALPDGETKSLRDGAVVVVIDDHAVQLNLASADIAIMAALSDYAAAAAHRSFAGGENRSPA